MENDKFKLKKRGRRWSFRKLAIVVVACVVLLVVGYFVIKQVFPSISSNNTSDTFVAAKNDANSKASSYLQKNDSTSAVAAYQSVIDSTPNKTDKASVYIDRASTFHQYDSAKYKSQVIADAVKAYETSPSAATATFVCDMARDYNDKATYDKYYAILLELTKNNSKEVE